MLKLIIWLIVIYIFFRLSARFLLPFLVKHYLKKFQKKFYSQNGNFSENNGKRNRINIQRTNDKSKKSNSNFGEYVDFEEINNENK